MTLWKAACPASTTAAASAIVASSMHDPSTAEASAIGAKYLIALSRTTTPPDICEIDGRKPANVCNSKGLSWKPIAKYSSASTRPLAKRARSGDVARSLT